MFIYLFKALPRTVTTISGDDLDIKSCCQDYSPRPGEHMAMKAIEQFLGVKAGECLRRQLIQVV